MVCFLLYFLLKFLVGSPRAPGSADDVVISSSGEVVIYINTNGTAVNSLVLSPTGSGRTTLVVVAALIVKNGIAFPAIYLTF